jgi:hypothetical protein
MTGVAKEDPGAMSCAQGQEEYLVTSTWNSRETGGDLLQCGWNGNEWRW